ncbi:hypothetical protein [Alteriqipengyuania lutimaris]|uniref:Lipoprotein n=1 Tax=Alteriqipengyuania lutimaris TaxID=1538146 RepID=A0A395LJ22_9SPHN|nr:hypothetical protein [Alteriqipengyuania lutimaris]MBB3034052.1 hypothetical protein [Alteriqipengyuania lutimaris]RDS77006.1 hypothetical protein DL238_04870 [Alteriqipengyuania lutimaris]
MRAILAIAAATTLSGCATSAAGLAATEIDASYSSEKSPKDWALCVAEAFQGSNMLRDDGTNWWIIRPNSYGVPISRWDFKPTPTGSVAELRSSIGLSDGDDKVRSCA